MRSIFLPASLAISLATVTTAQTCITSPFTGGNGGNPGGAVYYTVDVVPPNGVTFTSMDLNLDDAVVGSTVGCDIHARFGSGHAGNEGMPGWYYVTSGTGTMAGAGSPTTMSFGSTFWLPPGTNAVAVVATGGASHEYTNGNGGNQTVANPDLTLTLGSAANAPFTTATFSPRVANTTLCYNLGGGTSYPYFDVSTPAGGLPLIVDFTDRSWSNDPAGISLWQWDFDNDGTIDLSGNTPAEQNPQWGYGSPGWYSVTLQIVDMNGTTSRTRTDVVKVGEPTNNTDSADLLHYTFNDPPRTGDMRVFNAASSDIAPRFGTMSNDGWQGDPARVLFQGPEAGFGCLGEAGVISSNALDTGLALEAGNMTIAWWHRIGQTGVNTANAFAYVFGGPGSSMRCFIGGSAGVGLIRYSGTAIGDVNNTTDIKTGLADVWTHLALVVDNAAGTATWFVNGSPDPAVTFTPGAHVVARPEFWVGFHSGTQNYSLFYSMDDFRVYSRALSPAEVLVVANDAEPAVGTIYGTGCPGAGGVVPSIGASGGAPAVGNGSFAVELDDLEPNSFGGFVFGGFCNQATAGGGALPAPLTPLGLGFGTGCNLEVGGMLVVGFNFQTTGSTSQPVPVPNNPTLQGEHFYVQGAVIGSVLCVSDALDISVK